MHNNKNGSSDPSKTAELTVIGNSATIELKAEQDRQEQRLTNASHTHSRRVARVELDGGVSFSIYEPNLPLLIGRDPSCDICMPVSQVSRRHCELYLEDDLLCINDISTNGTVVGDKRLRGESAPIETRTSIFMAAKAMITVTPSVVEERRQSSADPRLDDRRNAERRTSAVIVDMEQRREVRRVSNRRLKVRRLREARS